MSEPGAARGRFVRMFGSAVANQALLSAASLIVSLILIRHTSDHQYGYYLLVIAALLLLASVQNAFYGPAMNARLARFDAGQRADLIGGLLRAQRRVWLAVILVLELLAGLLWSAGVLDADTGPIVTVGLAAAFVAMRREYLRIVLLAYRRAEDVLKADAVYVVLLVAGAASAVFSPVPAVTAVCGLALAAFAGSVLLSKFLYRHAPWNPRGAPGILREIAPLAIWSVAGAMVHWSFSQGYSYLVAGTLDVAAVAALGATRLLMMPVNLLSTGIGSLMQPLAANWLHHHDALTTLRRLSLFAGGLAVVAVCYFALTWLVRDWLFAVVLKKNFAQRDRLLLLWGAVGLVAVVRDQIVFLPVSRGRFKTLTAMALASAAAALCVSYWCMRRYGISGALVGMLVGEVSNLSGLLYLSAQEVRRDRSSRRSGISPSGG